MGNGFTNSITIHHLFERIIASIQTTCNYEILTQYQEFRRKKKLQANAIYQFPFFFFNFKT